MKFINHLDGYIEPDGAGGYDYVYQYKDHLGNVRLSYSDNSTVLTDNHFESSTEGWGGVATVLSQENGKLKAEVTNQWAGAQKYFDVAVGDELYYELLIDKATTDHLIVHIVEHDSNYGKLKTTAVVNGADGFISGTYTVTEGSKLRIKITKNGNDNGIPTYYYLDDVKVIKKDISIREESNYYPFGLEHKGYNAQVTGTEYPYDYNGKENNEEMGLNWHDFGARNYDAALGRWMSIDPLAENMREYSPYNYVLNSPITFIDPDGQAPYYDWEAHKNGKKGVYRDDNNNKISFDEALSQVTDTENDDNSTPESNNGDKPIGKNYKGKTQTAPATPLVDQNGKPNTKAYNCHSFAWCNSLGDPKDPANQNLVKYGITRWDNDPTNNTGGHTPLQFNDPNQVGDRVIYYAWDNKSGKVVPTHSAVVTKVDQKGNTVEVESKWGQAPRYKHHPRDVPASYGAKTPTFVAPDGKTYASRIYFRKNP